MWYIVAYEGWSPECGTTTPSRMYRSAGPCRHNVKVTIIRAALPHHSLSKLTISIIGVYELHSSTESLAGGRVRQPLNLTNQLQKTAY